MIVHPHGESGRYGDRLTCLWCGLGKWTAGVCHILEAIQQRLPSGILGFDSDGGSAFLNWYLFEYFTKRKRPVAYMCSRPCQSSDNAHIEEQNWSNIRGCLGYERFENREIVPLLNDPYQTELPLMVSFFLPSFKLLEKRREGSTIVKRHDAPKTLFVRLSQSGIPMRTKERSLVQLHASLNPFELQRRIRRNVTRILQLAAPVFGLPLGYIHCWVNTPDQSAADQGFAPSAA